MLEVSDLESENTTLPVKFKTSSKTHIETEVGRVKDPGDLPDDLGKKTKQCDVNRAMVGKLEKILATMRSVLKVSENKTQRLE